MANSLIMNYNGFDYAVRIIKRWNSFPQKARRGAIACFARFFKNASSQKNFFKSGNPCYHSILPQSLVSAQANRGFSAVGFETAIGGAA